MSETTPLPLTPEANVAPDFSHGYLRVPLSVWSSVYCRSPFTRRQLQLLSVVIRESWGWRAPDGSVYLWTRRLTPRQFSDITGLSTDRLGWELRSLVHRKVLREQDGRYQFVPLSHAWRQPTPRPAEITPSPAEMPVTTAKTSASTPELKKAKRRERNVAPPVDELSPTGDNSPFAARQPSTEPGASASGVESLVALLEVLAGPLAARDARTLRRWLAHAGIAAVWSAVGPLCVAGPQGLSARLAALLAHVAREHPAPEETDRADE